MIFLRNKLVALATAALLFSCSSSELTDTQKGDVRREVNAMLRNYFEDMKMVGLRAEIRYLKKSPDFYWIPPGFDQAIGYDTICSILERNSRYYKKVENLYDSLQVIVISRDAANYHGKIRSTMTDISGRTATYQLIESGTVVRTENGWQLLCGQTSMVQ